MMMMMTKIPRAVALVLCLSVMLQILTTSGEATPTSRSRTLEQFSSNSALSNENIYRILGTSSFNELDLVGQFIDYKDKYGKIYASSSELEKRFGIYTAKVQKAHAHNSGKASFSQGINAFTDMTFEEFKEAYLINKPQNCSATIGNHAMKSYSESTKPKFVDWRDSDIVSHVKNQKSCGSCWAFSATGALEAANAQVFKEIIPLSEQQLMDCSGAFGNNGCGGGLPSQAFEYLKYTGGLNTEGAYPYTGKGHAPCTGNPVASIGKVYEVVNITTGNEEELLDAVGFQRPVSIAYEVVEDFIGYSGGIYSSTECRQDSLSVNHAVLAVGYGVDENQKQFWIVKNSWGTDWGVDGYFLMERGTNMCGLASCASYPVVTPDV